MSFKYWNASVTLLRFLALLIVGFCSVSVFVSVSEIDFDSLTLVLALAQVVIA